MQLRAQKLIFLVLLATAAPAAAESLQTTSASDLAAVRQALAQGDLGPAVALDPALGIEAGYLRARALLAQGKLQAAEQALAALPAASSEALEVAWYIAHTRGDSASIAATAAAYCKAGDPTGRSCVDAEFYGGRILTPSVSLPGDVELPLSKSAPLPVTMGHVGAVSTGVLLDTGASQTVVSAALAQYLGLATTKASFPIGVAGGEGVTQARLAVLPALRLGDAVIETLPVLVVDLPQLDQVGVSVILSPQHALPGLAMQLDLANYRMTLSEKAPAEQPGETKVPYLTAGFDLVVPARVGDGPPALFAFDTGLEQAFVLSRAYEAAAKDANEGTTGGRVLYGAGAAAQVESVARRPVYLGEERVCESGGYLSDLPQSKVFPIAGMLGNDLWEHGMVVLDTQRRVFRVAHRPHQEAAPTPTAG